MFEKGTFRFPGVQFLYRAIGLQKLLLRKPDFGTSVFHWVVLIFMFVFVKKMLFDQLLFRVSLSQLFGFLIFFSVDVCDNYDLSAVA